jgi:hypothetical protein
MLPWIRVWPHGSMNMWIDVPSAFAQWLPFFADTPWSSSGTVHYGLCSLMTLILQMKHLLRTSVDDTSYTHSSVKEEWGRYIVRWTV